MKTTIIIFVIAIAAIMATGSVFCCANILANTTGKKLKGSGNRVTRIVELPPFDEVKASRGISVILLQSDSQQAEIVADDNVIDNIVVRVEERKLKIGIKPQFEVVSNIDVRVTVPTNGRLKGLEASSAAKISGDVVITVPELEIEASSAAKIEIKAIVAKCKADASSAAKIKADIEATECKIEASSAAKIEINAQVVNCEVEASSAAHIELSGKADYCKADFTSASKFSASNFAVANYTIGTSSGAKAEITCTNSLKADASSGSSIYYTGNCSADQHTSSGGSIRQK